MYKWILIVGILASNCASAQIYQTTDDKGRPVFTDSPPPDKEAKEVEIQETNTQPAVDFKPRRRYTQKERSYDISIQLTNPAEGTRFGPKDKYITVSAQLSEGLPPNHAIRFLMNGEALNAPAKSQSLTFRAGVKMRGQRALSAEVINLNNGEVIATSNAVNIIVIRPPGR